MTGLSFFSYFRVLSRFLHSYIFHKPHTFFKKKAGKEIL